MDTFILQIKKWRLYLSACLIGAIAFLVFAFGWPHPSTVIIDDTSICTESLSYDLEIIKYQALQDIADRYLLHDTEKAGFRRSVEKQHFEQCLDNAGNLTMEYRLMNPGNALNEWMPKLDKTLISRDSVVMYDNTGAVILARERVQPSKTTHDETTAEAVLDGLGIPTSFAGLVQKEQANLISEGFSISTDSEGNLLATNGNREVHFMMANLSIVDISSYENGRPVTITRQYSHNQEGLLVPAYEKYEESKTLPGSGVCIKEVMFINYSNYQRNDQPLGLISKNNTHGTVDGLSQTTLDTGRRQKMISLMPNPVSDYLTIDIDGLTHDTKSEEITIQIINVFGEQVPTGQNSRSNHGLTIDLNNLNPGFYVARFSTGGQLLSTAKFIKK